jgi:hypothetical protein
VAEHTAATLTPAAVQSAANLCSAGDTVVMPAGEATSWSTTVYLGVGVNLKGQGVDSTIIRQPSTTNRFFYFNSGGTVHGYTVEIQGFSVFGPNGYEDSPTWPTSGGTGYSLELKRGVVNVHDIEIHNKNYGFGMRDVTKGVIYNCLFKWIINNYSAATHGTGGYGVFNYRAATSWPGSFPAFGTEDAVFVEDCNFYGCKHATSGGACSNLVTRYCTIEKGWSSHGNLDAHGQRSGNEGTLSSEWYNNTVYLASEGIYEYLSNSPGVLYRGGQAIIANNAFISGGGSSSSDCIVISDVDITDAGTYSWPGDYPIYWQPRNCYSWGNTYSGAAVDPHEDDGYGGGNWFEEDRDGGDGILDYVTSAKSGYTPYTYPHPMRPTAGGGTYKMMHGVKVNIV